MDAVVNLAPDAEVLSWQEIRARYPEAYVCLVDVERGAGSPAIVRARVLGHGATRRAAFRAEAATYARHAVRFTGVCTEPLTRPALVVDDETLELLRA